MLVMCLIQYCDWKALYADIIANLSDTYSRFTQTPEYKSYIDVKITLHLEFQIQEDSNTDYSLLTN
jgi:hypothetical protein